MICSAIGFFGCGLWFILDRHESIGDGGRDGVAQSGVKSIPPSSSAAQSVASGPPIQIEQEGVFSRKAAIMIEWPHLRMRTANGTSTLRCYSTGKKAAFQIWHMSNNIVFGGVLNFLFDKANYRMLEATSKTRDAAQGVSG